MNGALDAIEERDNNVYRVYFNKTAIPDSIRKAGFQGKIDMNCWKVIIIQLVINTTKRIDVMSKQLAIQSKSLDEI
jgi:hypothetical protein